MPDHRISTSIPKSLLVSRSLTFFCDERDAFYDTLSPCLANLPTCTTLYYHTYASLYAVAKKYMDYSVCVMTLLASQNIVDLDAQKRAS